jgi:hypothetical protein
MSLQQVGLMIVINTSPAINLGRALGTLEVVVELYGSVVVPLEVLRPGWPAWKSLVPWACSYS